MASAATNTNSNEIVSEIPTYITLYKDGTVERPRQTPFARPSLDDPQTGVSSKDIVISHSPSIPARLYLPKSPHDPKLPILVYFHGGGFFFESAFSQLYHHYFNTFVSQVSVIVVSVEYRLAPEHPLPAGYDDSWAALQWVASHYSTDAPGGIDNPMVNPLAPGAPSLGGLACTKILVCAAGNDSFTQKGGLVLSGCEEEWMARGFGTVRRGRGGPYLSHLQSSI